MSVEEVGHEEETYEGKQEGEHLLVIRTPLGLVEVRPHEAVDSKSQQKRRVRGKEVQEKALFVNSCKKKNRDARFVFIYEKGYSR